MLVASQEPAIALAFAVGNFPQLVRHVQPILQAAELADLRPTGGRPIALPALVAWATEQTTYPEVLLAVGALRLGRRFEAAEQLLTRLRPDVPAEWQAALGNEEAALAWHSGRGEEALKLWQSLPDSVPVQFNRGMAALFTGNAALARESLQQVVPHLSEDSAWHHLGQLYLALAESRS
jgi:hypothetical protein